MMLMCTLAKSVGEAPLAHGALGKGE
jgi:hypothetical protein